MNRVLVVDPDSATLVFLQDVLDESYDIKMATSGREALELLSDFRPHVGVVEIVLEDMMGWHLVAKMREQIPHLPVIAIAADESWHNARQMRTKAEPILFYAVKPLNRHEMKETIGAAVTLGQHTLSRI